MSIGHCKGQGVDNGTPIPSTPNFFMLDNAIENKVKCNLVSRATSLTIHRQILLSKCSSLDWSCVG